jgi:hypothetical protein
MVMRLKSKLFAAVLVPLLLTALSPVAHGALIKITGTSAASGELGYFVVDDGIFPPPPTFHPLYASDFSDYFFSDPLNPTFTITPADVPSDTGVTYFDFVSGVWTVVGGGGDSLTTATGGSLWIAGTSYAYLDDGSGTRHDYADVSWMTTPVPESSTIALLGIGLLGLRFARRRRA